MYFLVYKTTNDINGKFYIGKHQTNNIHDGYLGSGKQLQRAVIKYGVDCFSREILFVFNNESEMNAKEAELVTEEFCARFDTYNICPGGKGGWGYVNINKMSPVFDNQTQLKFRNKFRQKMSSNSKFRHAFSQNNREIQIRNNTKPPGFNWTGKKHSTESKMKMRKSKNAGQRNSQYGTCWIHKDGLNRKCPKSEIDGWVKRGYTKGRCKGIGWN